MRPGLAALVVPAALLLAGCAGSGGLASQGGIHRIKHVVVIMQENRSFDSYFGTFPRADGFPTHGEGNFNSSVPDPRT